VTLGKLGVRLITTTDELNKSLIEYNYSCVIYEFYTMGVKYFDVVKSVIANAVSILDTVDISFYRECMMANVVGDKKVREKAKITYFLEMNVYRKADFIWTVSELDREILIKEGIENEKIFVIPNIHSVSSYTPTMKERRPKTLIFVGGFVHEPNVDAVKFFLNDIFPLIARRDPEVEVLIVGDSPPEEIQQMTGERIKVLGYVDDTQPYLDKATVSIAPLRYGAGLKGKVCEALASGLPLVTTSVGVQGMRLVSGRDCFVADKAESFAEATLTLMNDPVLWQSFSENGRAYMAENLSHESVRKTLLSFMARVCSSVR
jgi:glycosyltransferase involved in cell wall biosynthesis